ncbi:MAG: hypothetical protein ABIY51_05525 [Ferruginibacter sp.]
MDNSSLSPADSLQLIRSMIEKTKKEISDNSIYFLVWGWGAFIGCIGQYILKVIFNYPYHYRIWFITFICIIITMGLGMRKRKSQQVKTYVSDSMSYLWAGMGISFFIVSIIFSKIGWQYCFPFFILFYGLGTFVSGKILQYRPFQYGGLMAFALAIIAAWLDYDYQMLITALALLVSYIIPGHILQHKYRQSNKNEI